MPPFSFSGFVLTPRTLKERRIRQNSSNSSLRQNLKQFLKNPGKYIGHHKKGRCVGIHAHMKVENPHGMFSLITHHIESLSFRTPGCHVHLYRIGQRNAAAGISCTRALLTFTIPDTIHRGSRILLHATAGPGPRFLPAGNRHPVTGMRCFTPANRVKPFPSPALEE